jgi:hypothetical protein
LARIILSHALLESIRFVMSRKECRDIYGLINKLHPNSRPRLSVKAHQYRMDRHLESEYGAGGGSPAEKSNYHQGGDRRDARLYKMGRFLKRSTR